MDACLSVCLWRSVGAVPAGGAAFPQQSRTGAPRPGRLLLSSSSVGTWGQRPGTAAPLRSPSEPPKTLLRALYHSSRALPHSLSKPPIRTPPQPIRNLRDLPHPPQNPPRAIEVPSAPSQAPPGAPDPLLSTTSSFLHKRMRLADAHFRPHPGLRCTRPIRSLRPITAPRLRPASFCPLPPLLPSAFSIGRFERGCGQWARGGGWGGGLGRIEDMAAAQGEGGERSPGPGSGPELGSGLRHGGCREPGPTADPGPCGEESPCRPQGPVGPRGGHEVWVEGRCWGLRRRQWDVVCGEGVRLGPWLGRGRPYCPVSKQKDGERVFT